MRNYLPRRTAIFSFSLTMLTVLALLALLPLTAHAATTTTISDPASCEAFGGVRDEVYYEQSGGNYRCLFLNSYTIAAGDTLDIKLYSVFAGATVNVNGGILITHDTLINDGMININSGGAFRTFTEVDNFGSIYVSSGSTLDATYGNIVNFNSGTINVSCSTIIISSANIINRQPLTDCATPTSSITTNPTSPNGNNDWFNTYITVNLSAGDNSGGSGVQSLSYSLNNGTPTVVNAASASFTISTDGITKISYYATDNVGNAETVKTLTVKLDKTPPTITVSAKNADGTTYTAGTWTTQAVTVSFSCSDSLSGLSGSCPAPVTVSTPGITDAVSSGTVKDNAGNSTSTSFGPIKIGNPLLVAANLERAPDNNDWYNAPVKVTFVPTGGAGSVSCDTPITYSGPDSATASVTGSCSDQGGQNVSASTTFKYDATKPTVTYSGNAGTYTIDQTVNITCNAADNLSGIASSTCANISGPAYTFALGNNSFSASATDKAGNVGSGSTSFKVSVTFDSLCSLSRQFSTKSDVAQGLCDKLAAAKTAAVAGNTKEKNNNLEAYRNQLSAQSGKALTKQQATILTNLSKAL